MTGSYSSETPRVESKLHGIRTVEREGPGESWEEQEISESRLPCLSLTLYTEKQGACEIRITVYMTGPATSRARKTQCMLRPALKAV